MSYILCIIILYSQQLNYGQFWVLNRNLVWYQKPETKAQLASAKKIAWEQFTKQIPNADKDQFFVQTSVDEKYRISAEVFFKESADYSSSVFG